MCHEINNSIMLVQVATDMEKEINVMGSSDVISW